MPQPVGQHVAQPAHQRILNGQPILMIRRLRDDWTATRGGRAVWKQFHDQFLSYGGPPIPLVRQQLMGDEARAVF